METENSKIQAEVGHYKALGMAANAQDLVNKAAAQDGHIKEDQMAMAKLREATAVYYKTFRTAVDRAGGPGADWMIKAGISLVGIKQLLDRMSLAKDWLPGLAAVPTAPIPILSPVSSPPMKPIAPPSSSSASKPSTNQFQPQAPQNAARPPKAPALSPQQSALVSGTVVAPPNGGHNLAPGEYVHDRRHMHLSTRPCSYSLPARSFTPITHA